MLGILREVCGVVGARAGEGTVLLCGGVHVRHRCRIADEEGRIAEASGAPATASSLLESGNIKKLLSVRWVTRSPITSPPSCLLLLRVCCVTFMPLAAQGLLCHLHASCCSGFDVSP